MPYFNILSITSEGEVKNPFAIGQHAVNFNITKVGLEKHADSLHYIVEIKYDHSANNVLLFDLTVTTTWMILNLDQEGLEKAQQFIRHLLVRSISHFNGVLNTKVSDKGWRIMLPEDPELSRPIELTNDLVRQYFQA